jgi:hypothetical protein
LVSIAVTKIAAGTVSGTGDLLKGRVRSAVHRPDASSCCCTASRLRLAVRWHQRANATLLIAFNADHHRLQNAPFAALIALTVPLAGAK